MYEYYIGRDVYIKNQYIQFNVILSSIVVTRELISVKLT